MARRANTSSQSRKRGDDFDIDIEAELLLPSNTTPAQALDLLYEAINGKPGSRYHGIRR
jgi:hypothetical protein